TSLVAELALATKQTDVSPVLALAQLGRDHRVADAGPQVRTLEAERRCAGASAQDLAIPAEQQGRTRVGDDRLGLGGEVTFDLDAGADAQPRERAAEPVEAALGDLDARADDLRDSGDRLGAFVDRHAIVMPYAMHLVLEHLSGLERDANPLGRSLGSDPRLTPHDLQGTSGLVDHPRVTDRGHQCSRTEGHRGVATWATVVGIVG